MQLSIQKSSQKYSILLKVTKYWTNNDGIMTKYETKYGKNKPDTGKIWLSTGKIIRNTDPNQALTFVWRSGKSKSVLIMPVSVRITVKSVYLIGVNVVFSNTTRLSRFCKEISPAKMAVTKQRKVLEGYRIPWKSSISLRSSIASASKKCEYWSIEGATNSV